MTKEEKIYLDYLFSDNKIVELRSQSFEDHWKTHWFNNVDKLINKVDKLYDQGNLFTSLNRPSNLTNKAIRDDDVLNYSRLFFDFDPVRKAGLSSTKKEFSLSRKIAIKLVQFLNEKGWPEPLKAISGNGSHVQYRVLLQNNNETKEILDTIYNGLALDFSTENVIFDKSVKNPGRICTLYGTVKRKGIHTGIRPHRKSLSVIPETWSRVSTQLIEQLANFYANNINLVDKPVCNKRIKFGKGDYNTLNIVELFKSHNLYLKHANDNKHYVTCPWHEVHSNTGNTDTVIWETSADKWPSFHCSHNHCSNRHILDVINHFSDTDKYCTSNFNSINKFKKVGF